MILSLGIISCSGSEKNVSEIPFCSTYWSFPYGDSESAEYQRKAPKEHFTWYQNNEIANKCLCERLDPQKCFEEAEKINKK